MAESNDQPRIFGSAANESAIRAADGHDVVAAFDAAMDSDLNTPAALAVIFTAMTQSRSGGEQAVYPSLADRVKKTFGCFEPEGEEIPSEVLRLLNERERARKSKDFLASDSLRDAILSLGYTVKDTPSGQKASRL